MTYEEAIEYVAQQVASDRAAEKDDWDGYPDISLRDWTVVDARVFELATTRRPRPELYKEAYALLAARVLASRAETE